MTSVAIGLYLLVLIGVVFLRSKSIPSAKVQLFRALFPSWKFFDDIGIIPLLYYRVSSGQGQMGEWILALNKEKRSLSAILFNGKGNLNLAINSAIQQLLLDFEATETNKLQELFKESVAFRIADQWVQYECKNKVNNDNKIKYQLKICVKSEAEPDSLVEEWFISDVYEMEPFKCN